MDTTDLCQILIGASIIDSYAETMAKMSFYDLTYWS